MEWTAPHPPRRPYPAEIEEGRHKIEELDQQIAYLTNQTKEPTRLRLHLEQERRNCESFIAPFRRMPTEILCEIAWHAVWQGTSRLVLNQICALMRDAVNGFKALWNYIYITKDTSCFGYRIGVTCGNRQWLQVLLDRVSPSPLFIQIKASGFIAEMLEPLIPFSPYIETIYMEEGDGSISVPLIQLSAMNFSGLRSFSYMTPHEVPTPLFKILDIINLSCHHQLTLKLYLKLIAFYSVLVHSVVGKVSKLILESDYTYYPYRPRDRFKVVPMPYFRSLKTTGVPCLFTASSLSSLTHLDLQGGYGWEQIDIEDIPHGIQSLTMHEYIIDQQHEDSASVYRFPYLRHIKFIEPIMKVRGGCILAPRLEWLEVTCDRYHRPMEFSTQFGDHFINGALFGSHSLFRLHLCGFKITSSSVQIMKSLNTCQDLDLEYCQVSNCFVIGLSSSPGSPDALFPILEKLHAPYSTRNESQHSLYELLEENGMNRPSLNVNW